MTPGSAWFRGLAAVAATALLAGCASDEPPQRGPGGPGGSAGPRGPMHVGPTLFVSLAGQPFRAKAGEPYPVARWFAQVDRKGDGKIDRAEVRADAAAFFKILDKNHDGVIDAFELADYEQVIAPEILGAYGGGGSNEPRAAPSQSGGGGGGGGRGGGRRGGGGYGRGSSGAQQRASDGVEQYQGAAAFSLTPDPEPVASADTALDGKITEAEFLAAVDRRFDALDTKHLGYLTLADLPKTPAQRRMAVHKPGQPGAAPPPGAPPPK
jgi:hypothetical protein